MGPQISATGKDSFIGSSGLTLFTLRAVLILVHLTGLSFVGYVVYVLIDPINFWWNVRRFNHFGWIFHQSLSREVLVLSIVAFSAFHFLSLLGLMAKLRFGIYLFTLTNLVFALNSLFGPTDVNWGVLCGVVLSIAFAWLFAVEFALVGPGAIPVGDLSGELGSGAASASVHQPLEDNLVTEQESAAKDPKSNHDVVDKLIFD